MHEDGVVGGGEVGAGCALIPGQEEEHPRVALLEVLLLELVQGASLLVHRPLELERLDVSLGENLANLLHQVGELDKDQDALILRGVLDALHEVGHLGTVHAALELLQGDALLGFGGFLRLFHRGFDLLGGALGDSLGAEGLGADDGAEPGGALASGNPALGVGGVPLEAVQAADVAAGGQQTALRLGLADVGSTLALATLGGRARLGGAHEAGHLIRGYHLLHVADAAEEP